MTEHAIPPLQDVKLTRATSGEIIPSGKRQHRPDHVAAPAPLRAAPYLLAVRYARKPTKPKTKESKKEEVEEKSGKKEEEKKEKKGRRSYKLPPFEKKELKKEKHEECKEGLLRSPRPQERNPLYVSLESDSLSL